MHEQFMKRAIELSRQHMLAGDGGPFGAVLVKDGKIIGEGWNCVTSTNDPTAHTEVVAIRNACKTMNSFELYEVDLYTSCEPCPMCLSAAYWARVRTIYFASTRQDAARHHFDDEFIYQEIPRNVEDRSIPMIQIMQPKAYEVFKEWDLKADRIEY
jgi:guanine deaminase